MTDKLQLFLNAFQLLPDAIVPEEEGIFFSDINVKIIFLHYDVTQMDTEAYYATASITIESAQLKQPIRDMLSGSGRTEEEAIQNAVQCFSVAPLSAFRYLAKGESIASLNTDFLGAEKKWSLILSDFCNIGVGVQKEQDTDFLSIFGSELLQRLGNRDDYYIRMCAVELPTGDLIGEVMINWVKDYELSYLLRQYIEKNWKHGEYRSLKQYAIIRQDDTSNYPYGYTDITKMVKNSLAVFANLEIADQDNYSVIMDIVKDESLAIELTLMIPEIVGELCMNVQPSDEFVLAQKDQEPIRIYRSQLFSYAMIYNVICDYLENEPDEDLINKLCNMSSVSKVVMYHDNQDIQMNRITSYNMGDCAYQFR